MRMPNRIRRRLDHAVRTRIDEYRRSTDEELGRRLDELAARTGELAAAVDLKNVSERVDELAARAGELAAAVDLKNVSERVDRLDEVTRGFEERLARLEGQASWDTHQLSRLSSQAAAFEQRLEGQARPIVVTGTEEVAEPHLLVDVVREEHARVRARLSILSSYEERIRRLEERAFPLDGA
ncbi:hypothetical protein ACI784_11410 [Geodermatophilus sp. SYSU D01186]